MKIWVLVGCYSGVIDEVKVFTDEAEAKCAEKKLCEDYGITEERPGPETEHALGLYEFDIIVS